MTIYAFDQPIPVNTDLGSGYILYVKSNGMYQNDEFCVVLENGDLRHFITTQLKIQRNETYNINTANER